MSPPITATSAQAPRALNAYKPFWAKRLGVAPFLPMSRDEMARLGWDSCDVILVTGDAYVDHPSFGMAVVGRVLEAQGFRVGLLAQPDWHSAEPFKALGPPNLFWGVTAGNMDSMINRYTADRKIRSDDAYTPGDVGGRRPDRAAIVYCQRCREAYPEVPIVLGGIEGSLRRIAHYDYWSDTVRRSIVADARCDLLLYGNAERALVEVAHRLAARTPIAAITDVRGSAFERRRDDPALADWSLIDSTEVDLPGPAQPWPNPYADTSASASVNPSSSADATNTVASCAAATGVVAQISLQSLGRRGAQAVRSRSVIRLPSYQQVKADPLLYAHANRVLHLETNPGNARALVQAQGDTRRDATARDIWINPPPIPLSTAEMDWVFGLPYARSPHPAYADAQGRFDRSTRIPAWEMIKTSVNIMRGCFGGCTFCSITEHEGRIIQSRSSASILREIEDIRDKVTGFTGVISDLGGPTANMYRLGCASPSIEAACRKPSCVFPGICSNLRTDHGPLVQLYRQARALRGVKKILIGSGVRYDLAVRSPDYVRELVQHHVGGYLKIAPEHTEAGPLGKMMKPGIATYDRFKEMFERYSAEAGKQQFLIPYFIAAHPGTSDTDMMNLALWLKRNGFRADQVQTFYPSPMASATAMYHSGLDPLHGLHRDARSQPVDVVRGERRRRLHKAFLRYHDPANWPLLREALKAMGRADLIGNGKQHLIPSWQPATDQGYASPRRKNATPARTPLAALRPGVRPPASAASAGRVLTQHTGLPPRAGLKQGPSIRNRSGRG